MSQRISLTRIIAVHWYGFRQIIDVSNDTLISGKFGTGKSALLDLMQCVLLGEHWRPNRAAAGNARGRTLSGYCLCDTNTLRDGEPHYTRSSAVTLIGLEFSWPLDKGQAAPRRETWGMRLEYSSPTAEPKRTYFLVPERVEWTMLAPDGQMLDEEAYRTWIRRDYGRDCLFARQQDYLAEMATPRHLYFDLDQFHKTFPKAIAFKPEENVEKFIREFILEENPLDVRDVRASVAAYRDTLARLEKQEDEAVHLRRIVTHHTELEQARRAAALAEHTRHTLEQARLSELVERHRTDLAALAEQHASDNKVFEATLKEQETLGRQLKEFALDAGDAELEQARQTKLEVQRELGVLRDAQASVRERLRNRAFGWRGWLKSAAGLRLDGLPALLQIDDALLAALSGEAELAALAALTSLAERFKELFHQVGNLLLPVAQQLEGENQRLRRLAEDLDRLDRNETPGGFPLFDTIKKRLTNAASPPEQLCRLVEVKPDQEEWRDALEMMLGRNRFAVVVAPEDYRRALEILKTTKSDFESLVHPREAAELPAAVRRGSLADKVEVKHPVAANFVRHLLGRIGAVDRVEELDAHDRAITRDGIFKQTPTRRRLRPTPGFEFTLGTEGIKRLRASVLREQKELMITRDTRERLIQAVHRWLDEGKRAGLDDARLPDRSGELARIPELAARLDQINQRIAFLATDERQSRLAKRDQMQTDFARASQTLGELRNNRQGYQQKQKELGEALDRALEDLASAQLAVQESRLSLPNGILDSETEATLREIMAAHPRWHERVNAAQQRATAATAQAATARAARNLARQELATSQRHPEYRHDFPVTEEDNDPWSARLRLLEETQLPTYRSLADERRKDWEKRLQESVLDRLNERLHEAERTVKQLRDYLDRDIGAYRYRITFRRDPAFGPLWKLLDSGFEPTDELLKASRSDEVQEALHLLMTAVEAPEQADDRSRRLLDYRQYHRYDLEMVQAKLPDAPPISLARSGRNLSGGENQAPFFISMLAAFRRVYDLGSGRSQHMGLVVMDEAFSKLSGDGVEDCLELARNFNLQLILAFPPEKLGVISPYADTIIMCRKSEKRDEKTGYVTEIDNIPIRLTRVQAEECFE